MFSNMLNLDCHVTKFDLIAKIAPWPMYFRNNISEIFSTALQDRLVQLQKGLTMMSRILREETEYDREFSLSYLKIVRKKKEEYKISLFDQG